MGRVALILLRFRWDAVEMTSRVIYLLCAVYCCIQHDILFARQTVKVGPAWSSISMPRSSAIFCVQPTDRVFHGENSQHPGGDEYCSTSSGFFNSCTQQMIPSIALKRPKKCFGLQFLELIMRPSKDRAYYFHLNTVDRDSKNYCKQKSEYSTVFILNAGKWDQYSFRYTLELRRRAPPGGCGSHHRRCMYSHALLTDWPSYRYKKGGNLLPDSRSCFTP